MYNPHLEKFIRVADALSQDAKYIFGSENAREILANLGQNKVSSASYLSAAPLYEANMSHQCH